MSFLKKLFGFGGGSPEDAKPSAGPTEDYKGFTITSTPFKADGQWQLCGVVSKTVDGVVREHRFIRADKFTDLDQAHEVAMQKGRLIVDQQGEALFG
jgi:hypothetical protein